MLLPLTGGASAPVDPTKWVGPGLLGFVVIAGIGVAMVLLWRNMNKQLRKVRFEEPSAKRSVRPSAEPGAEAEPPGDGDAADGGSGGAGPEPR
ncbi:hypothetical protein [Actinopolymorpha alba]|uniref:hypothetical protein n=1 Tax=Actinopolymorpha alba TaxID=533267 RepID=UPI0012F6FC62|nr:hypothetical protein [Actinopolymorpha alba]